MCNMVRMCRSAGFTTRWVGLWFGEQINRPVTQQPALVRAPVLMLYSRNHQGCELAVYTNSK